MTQPVIFDPLPTDPQPAAPSPSIPSSPLDRAMAYREAYESGFAQPTPTEEDPDDRRAGLLAGPVGSLAAGAYGLARIPTLGLSDAVLMGAARRYGGESVAKELGEGVSYLKEKHPGATFAGELAGGFIPSPLGLLGRGAGAMARAPLGLLARTGKAAAHGAFEGAAFGAGTEFSEEMLGNENLNAQHIVSQGLLGGMLGAGIGGAFHLGAEALTGSARTLGLGTKEGVAKAKSFADKMAEGHDAIQAEANRMRQVNPSLSESQAFQAAAEKHGNSKLADEALDVAINGSKDLDDDMKAYLMEKKKDPEWRDRFLSKEPERVLQDVGAVAEKNMQELADASDELMELAQAPMKRDIVGKNIDPANHQAAMKSALDNALREKGLLQRAEIIAQERGFQMGSPDFVHYRQLLDRHIDRLKGNDKAWTSFVPAEFKPDPRYVFETKPFQAKPFVPPEFKPPKAPILSQEAEMRVMGEYRQQVLEARLEHDVREAERFAIHNNNEAARRSEYAARQAELKAAHEKQVADALGQWETRRDKYLREVYKDPTDLYMAEDELKRMQGKYARRLEIRKNLANADPRHIAEAELLSDVFKPSHEVRRLYLEDEALFGTMGKLQKEANEQLKVAVDLKRFVRGNLFKEVGTKQVAGGEFEANWVADRAKIDNFVGGLLNPKKNPVNDAVKSWINATEQYAGVMEKFGALGEKAPAAAKLKNALKELRAGYVDAEEALVMANAKRVLKGAQGRPIPNFPRRDLGVVGAMGGGVPGAVAGAGVGAVVGGAVDALRSPYRAYLFYHSVQKAKAAFHKVMGMIFSKTPEAAQRVENISNKQLKAIAKSVREFKVNPEALNAAIDRAVGTLADIAPKHAAAMAATITRAVLFLAESAPKDRRAPSLQMRGEPKYSPTDEKIFETKALVALNGPSSAVTLALLGKLNRHAIESLERVYPDVYQEMKAAVLDKAQDPRVNLSIQQEAMLAILFKVAVSGSTTPKFTRAMQSTYALAGKSGPASPAAPTGSPNFKWGHSVFETQAQRTESRR